MAERAPGSPGRPGKAARPSRRKARGLPRDLPPRPDSDLAGDEFPAQPRSVGRERYLAQLLDGLKSALSGSSWASLISGEAGVGKTRLLQELLDRAQAHDCHVLSGRAQDFDQGITYATLRDVLASVAADDFEEPSRASLCDLLRS